MASQKRTESWEAGRFALILGGMCVLTASFSLWRQHETRAGIVGGLGIAGVTCMLLLPRVWIRIYRVWMKFGKLLSLVVTVVILTAFFFLILTPFGLLSRLFRRDPLDLSWRARRPSYWIEKRNEEPTLERYERQF